MKILNLHAGIGGNRKLWGEEHDITAVEIDEEIANVYKIQNPKDKLIIGDAMEYLKNHRNKFDFIWASPTCQKHGRMMKATRHDIADYFDLSLYQIIIFLTHFYNNKWAVENVKPYYDPLIKPTFTTGRHYFWSNFEIKSFEAPTFKNFITSGTVKESEMLKDWLGIHYEGNIYYNGNHCPGQVLRNCVHPKTGLHILNCAMNIITKQNEKQIEIFE